VKIACIGGGPAGLYLGILVKRAAPEHEVVVYERNRAQDTFGFGVVFSDATLDHLAAADPQTHAQITARFARWDDIEIHVGGEVSRSTGHGFCGIERKLLLAILQARAQELGVRVEFEHEVRALTDVRADVVVGCDGVASWVRDALAAELAPRVDVRPNKFVWLGCTVPFRAFTFMFKATPHGLFRVHAYRYAEGQSTFIVECRQDTWRAADLDRADEDGTLAILSRVFADELGAHRLVKNRSIWRNFPTVRCARWHCAPGAPAGTGNVVLLGDAAHTAHFSIGSGTKLAMEDAIALRDELVATRDIGAALAAYEARRRPEVEALQAAAQASLEWFEGTERYMHMPPTQLSYSLMTRSLRVSHASVGRRDPQLARGVERLLAASAGVTDDPPPAPTTLPLALGDRRARSRIVFAPFTNTDSAQLPDEEAAFAGVGMLVARLPSSLCENTDRNVTIWRRVTDNAHDGGPLVVAHVETRGSDIAQAAALAARADFDVLLLDPGNDPEAIELLPAAVQAARGTWRPGGWISACVQDRPAARAAVIGHAAQLQRAGANLLWVSSQGHADMVGARLPAVSLADQLRNELGIATAICDSGTGDALLPDLDAAIAAGRCDLVVVPRIPAGART
jgi:2-polyprenyl-6-methoxyphenol hydroxylase-like FAD-dependent oxidoreductase